MKCLYYLITSFTLALAIRVPSSWQEDRRIGSKIVYRDIRPLRSNRNINLLQLSNPLETVYRKRNVPLKPRNVPKTNKFSELTMTPTPYITQPKYKQEVPSVMLSIQPKIIPVANHVQLRKNVEHRDSKNVPSFTTIIPDIHSTYSFPETTNQKFTEFTPTPNLAANPLLQNIHYSSSIPSNKKIQVIPNQKHILDFISSPLDFRDFGSSNSADKFQQNKPVPLESSSKLVPHQISTIPTNHKSQHETTGHNQETIFGSNQPSSQNFDQSFNIPFNRDFVSSNNKHNFDPKNHLFKNYRDDKIHEPIGFDPFVDNTATPFVVRDESEKAPISLHEYPAEIPTKPIYPGEGLWARRGLSHKPFISKQIYSTLEEDTNIPDGYDTFIVAEKMFNKKLNKFDKYSNSFPKKPETLVDQQQRQLNPIATKPETETVRNEGFNNSANINDEVDDGHEDEFVPMKLYAQVRHSENVEYLPTHEDGNGRLREAIKESKIQTVYTEEGYEDNAYDHEGHEKEAENKEEFEELDRGQEKAMEKRVPNKKYNLHLRPKIESTRYSSGLKLPTDEEIENYKKAELDLGNDADIAASHYEEPSIFNDGQMKNESSDEFQSYNSPNIMKSNNFISTKEIKTMTTKEKDDGDTETEISSRIKVIMQPNNTAKAHKFIRINPKLYKNWRKLDRNLDSHNGNKAKFDQISTQVPDKNGFYIEEIITPSTPPQFTTLPTTELPEMLSEEIPITTLPTTAIPRRTKISKNLRETLNNIDEAFTKVNVRSRKKRFANDFPNIKVDNSFISKIKHEIELPQEDQTKAKYPYYENYKQIDLNENSPLRYSEDLNNMPIKKEQKMTFYEEADTRIECPEIESTVEPIPERVQNAGQEEDSDHEIDDGSDESEHVTEDNKKPPALVDQPKGPRLNMLGDKIDCLKVKYFGENPLDSPFFDEETVGPVKTIFKNSAGVKMETKIYESDPDNVSAETQNPTSYIDDIENEIINEINVGGRRGRISVDPKSKIPNKIIRNTLKINVSNNSANLGSVKRIVDSKSTPIAPAKETIPIVKQVEDKQIIPNAPVEFDDEKLGFNVLTDISENMASLNGINSNNSTQIPPNTMGTASIVNLLTTPEYTIDLKPKHIYDQIDLLNYLPADQSTIKNISDTNLIKMVPSIDIRLMTGNETVDSDSETRQQKSYEAEEEDKLTFGSSSMTQVLPDAEALRKRRRFRIRRKRPGFQIFDVNKFIPAPYNIRKGHFNPSSSSISKGFKIFDINKFLPTTPYPITIDQIPSSTVLPKYKVLSEVFYKDDIKPNEQLNVFTDILNNIRNSSGEIDTDSSHESSDINIASNVRDDISPTSSMNIYNKDTYLNAYNHEQVDDQYFTSEVTEISTNEPQIQRGSIRFTTDLNRNKPITINRPVQNIDQKLKLYVALLEAKMRQSNERNNSTGYIPTSRPLENAYSEKYLTKVEGMNPPGSQRYKTIFHPKRDNNVHVSIPGYVGPNLINKYIVMGMKPPPIQRVLVYSDFSQKNNQLKKRKGLLRRSRRSTNRAAYAEVSRNIGTPPEDDKSANDDEDDYVPHRPKNYYYDEKTGEIVYNNVKKPLEEEEDAEIEYIEITEAPLPKTTSKPKQNPIFATASPPPVGHSYIDFVKKLKSAENYIFIPDPTTTEKNSEQITETGTTPSPMSTTPPEFLSILAKVRETSDYRIIKDPIENKKTTTEAPEEKIEEDYDEETDTNLRNSAGGEQHSITNNFQIFDISDYIPKLKNYLPRTSIDYSKYKSIERPASKDHQKSIEDSESAIVQLQLESESSTTVKDDKESIEEEEEFIEDVSPVQIATTTTVPMKVHTTSVSRRRRPTTLRSMRTIARATPTKPPTLAAAESQEVRNEKPRRNYRRRPTRIKSTTTQRFLEDDTDETTKIIRRRKIDEKNESEMTRDGKSRQIITDDDENSTLSGIISNSAKIIPEKLVEIFQQYNQDDKHGGNYRKENDQKLKLLEPASGASRRTKDVEIINKFDKSKRHGGNYNDEDDNQRELTEEVEVSDRIEHPELGQHESSLSKSEDASFTIQLLPKFKIDMTEYPHSKAEETIDDDKLIHNTNNHPDRRRITRKYKKYPENYRAVGRLTDVVPKPESFYSDPYLPRSINLLMLAQPLSNEESGETVEEYRDITVADLAASNRKPSFIKDPGERLYYYAPL